MIPWPKSPLSGRSRRTAITFGCALFAAAPAWSQETASPSPTPAPDDSAASPAGDFSEDESDLVVLSPFEVTGESTVGYLATRTLSGTRLNTKLEDVAASISVVTKEQLQDTASVDINDIFLYEGNTEGTHQYTDFEFVSGSGNTGDMFVDRTGTSPSTANRIRSMGSANVSLGGFEKTGGVPIDTYNIDTVEISRGPNSNIFGLGGAAGTVNLITSQAQVSEKSGRASFRADSYGGWRVEGDYNVPLIPDVFALRILAMYEDKGFTREPAYDITRRHTVAGTFLPFPKTKLSASYESYTNDNSLPNSITPRDLVTPWIEAGSPVWNPLTRTLTRQSDGVVLASGVTWNNRATQLFRPGYGVDVYSDGFATRVNQFIDQGEMALYTIGRITTPPTTSNPIPGPITNQGQNGYFVTTGQVFDPRYDVLWRPKGVSDRALYDYKNLNFAGANFGNREASDVRVTLDQELIRNETHHLAIQGAYFGQKVDARSRDFIGGSGGIPTTLMVDINTNLLDGSPNPFYLRPFMSGSEPQKRWSLDESDTFRGQAAYVLDLERRDNWLRWLGRQSVVAYGEHRERTSGTLGFRDYITSEHAWLPFLNSNGTVRAKVSNSYRQTVRYYMGDNSGYDIDYAPKRLQSTEGEQTLYWYNAGTGQWVNEDVMFEELHDSGRMKREMRYTMGGVWQANMFKDIIVPTVGYRRDRLTEFEGPSRTFDEFGYPDLSPMWNFDDPDFAYNKSRSAGETTTLGVVVKPLSWLYAHYNQSDSFLPAGIAYDIWRNTLANPRGEGKDYGFTLLLADEKLVIKYNQYETIEENARTGGNSGTMTSRMQRIDFDISRTEGRLPASTDFWHLESQAYHWVLAEHRIVDSSMLDLAQVEAYRREAWEKYIEPSGLPFEYREWFMDGPTRSFADTNTAKARGREVEISYNPSRYFTLKGTITQSKAFDSGVSVSNTSWLETRLPQWQAIRIPSDLQRYNTTNGTWEADPRAGQSWWTTVEPESNMAPQTWFLTNVDSQMALINARAGQQKPQIREWRFNTTIRYNLAGLQTDNFLKNLTVGGTLRWEDKAAVGYLALEPEVMTDDFVYYRYDSTKPVYDSANTELDLMAFYRLRLWDKVDCRIQLNIKNVLESGGLRVVGVNPDGEARDYRIIDPRQFSLTTTFEF